MEGVECVGKGCLDACEFSKDLAVGLGEFALCGNDSAKVFMCEDYGAVDEVAEDGDKLVVVACLEVGPSEIVVLGFGSICSEHVAEHILLAGEILKIFVEPYSPVARGGNLVAFEVEEFVGGNVVGELEVISVGHEHRGEDDAVEDDVVFADEVDDTAFGVLPVFFPSVGEKFLCVGDIADGSIKPDIEDFAFSAFHGYGNTPFEVAADGARLQTGIKP